MYIKRSRKESDIKANKTGELLERQQSRDLIMGVDESSETIIIVNCSYIYFHSSAVVQRSFIWEAEKKGGNFRAGSMSHHMKKVMTELIEDQDIQHGKRLDKLEKEICVSL